MMEWKQQQQQQRRGRRRMDGQEERRSGEGEARRGIAGVGWFAADPFASPALQFAQLLFGQQYIE